MADVGSMALITLEGEYAHFSYHDAANKIQGLFRGYRAHNQILQMVKSVYQKHFDKDSGG
jgi:hypothetical protein